MARVKRELVVLSAKSYIIDTQISMRFPVFVTFYLGSTTSYKFYVLIPISNAFFETFTFFLIIHNYGCRVALPRQSFVSFGSGKFLLQDEDHSGNRPHLFPGLCRMRSGTSPKRFRSGPELVGSEESRQDGVTRLKRAFPSY